MQNSYRGKELNKSILQTAAVSSVFILLLYCQVPGGGEALPPDHQHHLLPEPGHAPPPQHPHRDPGQDQSAPRRKLAKSESVFFIYLYFVHAIKYKYLTYYFN